MHVRVQVDSDVSVVECVAVEGTLVLKSIQFFPDGFLVEPHTSIHVLAPEIGFSERFQSPDEFGTVVSRLIRKLLLREG